MIGVGIGLPFFKSFGGIDAQAQAHFNRVIADGGLVPSGLNGVNAFFNTIKTIYGTADINTAISVGLDPQVLGYKLGAGAGTTAGQAAQKLYSPKDVFGGIGTGNAYWEGSGVSGNRVNATAYTTNYTSIEFNTYVNCTDTVSAATNTIGGLGNDEIFQLYNNSTTTFYLIFYWRNNAGVQKFAQSTAIAMTSINNKYIKITVENSGADQICKMYTSSDNVTFANVYQQTITTSTGFTNGSKIPSVGAYNTVAGEFEGKIYRMTFANSIGGAPVVDFNPNQYTGANTWTSTTSEVWTVNRTGAGLADVVQTTAASQPLLLVHEGANYWFGSGVTGNFCSTPNSVANSNNGNKEIIVKFSTNDTTSFSDIVSKDEVGSNRAYAILYDHSNQRFSLVLTTDLQSTTVVNTDSGTILRNYSGWYKVTMTFSGGVLSIKTFESLDNITYTQVGSTITRNGNNFIGTDAILNIGSRSTTSGSCIAKIDRLTISNSIGGAPVVDFNPNQYNAATSQTQWTSSTGEVWTINTGTAATGYKGVLVDRTRVMSDGINDSMTSSYSTSNANITVYMADTLFVVEAVKSSGGINSLNGNFAQRNATQRRMWIDDGNNAVDPATTANISTLNLGIGSITATNSLARINNGADATVTQVFTPVNRTINIFGSYTFGQTCFNTFLLSSNINNGTTKTAMYNYIRSINNNAF
jgi:hypothetical protein